ncbi:hypothetical protein [Mucilaginibacter sp.]|jgi:hypothetical protein|uniref:hypothetical protein n=1 Tax=Mucilaginibacter sp. TaxID=1882438 RepID=UPI002C7333AB|nr:hypothetical protein [Mucilaginibacter sp.]HTI57989.1 hypothetical protein [Mucilaginibacter sp.]
MKTLILSIALMFALSIVNAQDDGNSVVRTYQVDHGRNAPIATVHDSIRLQIDSNMAWYQKTFKTDSDIKVSKIFLRALQFMAAKNFQQNYGYEPEGKMIFTTTQDLNPTQPGNYDELQIYTVQFAVTIDIKNARYRTTIHNVTFYLPSETGNRRLTLKEMNQRAVFGSSRSVRKEAARIMESFERYLVGLTNELYVEVEHKAIIYDPKF